MAVPRKYLRPIVIDSISYLWRAHRYDNDGLPYLQVEVVDHGQTGPALTTYIDLFKIHSDGIEAQRGPVEYFSCQVTPAMIRELIVYGLENGWQPVRGTKACQVEAAKASPTLVAAVRPESPAD